MELYWKAAAMALTILVLGKSIARQDIALILGLMASVMVGLLLMHYLEPVIEFLDQLHKIGDIQGNMLGILMKILGIGILTELTDMVCKDAGNASLGKAMQLLGTAVILWLALPIFRTLIQLIQKILGET